MENFQNLFEGLVFTSQTTLQRSNFVAFEYSLRQTIRCNFYYTLFLKLQSEGLFPVLDFLSLFYVEY